MVSVQKVESAEKQIYEHQQEVAYDTRDIIIETLVSKYLIGLEKDENEIYVPDYQREFVWDEERQSKFIESIILGLPMPYIFLADMRDGRLEIIDGSQRIRTLAAFINNELKLKNLDILTELLGFCFKDLSINRQRKFRNTPIRTIVLSDKASEDVRVEMFKRINKGSDILNEMEHRKGTTRGSFSKFIEKCSQNDLFNELCLLSDTSKLRQEDLELILRFFAFYDSYPNFKKGLSSFLNDYLRNKNKEFNEDIETKMSSIFNNMLHFVKEHFPNGFAKPNGTKYASKLFFEATSVGVALALKEDNELISKKKVNMDWLYDDDFTKNVQPKYHTHTPSLIKTRIDLVKNALLGLPFEFSLKSVKIN
jgi:uncharacterized protein with ParB-like and HNH nuclease domain